MRLVRHFCALFPAAAVVLMTAPLWAAEIPADSMPNPDNGLPQFNPAYFPSQIFWLIITFGILYVLMSRVALPSVESVHKKRRDAIEKELAAATAANETARKTIAEYEKILADAKTEAIKAEDSTQASKESLERQAEQQRVLKRMVHQAEVRIAAARDAALREAEVSATEIATAIVDKITGLKLQVK